jgi:hypothetical protein
MRKKTSREAVLAQARSIECRHITQVNSSQELLVDLEARLLKLYYTPQRPALPYHLIDQSAE